jgi:Rrf2 family protein
MINQTVETAFRVLLYLGGQDPKSLVSLQEIHKIVGGSATYLAKVTAGLSRAGLLKSQRGAQGGLQIGREPKKINLLEVVEATQGPFLAFSPAKCVAGKGKLCNYHQTTEKLNALVTGAMRKATLADMMPSDANSANGCILKGAKKGR